MLTEKEIAPKKQRTVPREKWREERDGGSVAREMDRRETEEEAKRERLGSVFTAQRIQFSN